MAFLNSVLGLEKCSGVDVSSESTPEQFLDWVFNPSKFWHVPGRWHLVTSVRFDF